MVTNSKFNQGPDGCAGLCTRNGECLKNGKPSCPVIPEISDELIFVKKKLSTKCNYYMPFGYDGFCTCPHRKEIFKRCGI